MLVIFTHFIEAELKTVDCSTVASYCLAIFYRLFTGGKIAVIRICHLAILTINSNCQTLTKLIWLGLVLWIPILVPFSTVLVSQVYR